MISGSSLVLQLKVMSNRYVDFMSSDLIVLLRIEDPSCVLHSYHAKMIDEKITFCATQESRQILVLTNLNIKSYWGGVPTLRKLEVHRSGVDRYLSNTS